MLPAPSPYWVLRQHAPSPVHTVEFANGGELLVVGDADGRVSITGLRDLRPVVMWRAHSAALLRASAWRNYIVTHGRDNCVCAWTMPETAASVTSGAPNAAPGPAPTLQLRVDVNTLNYCAYDMVLIPDTHGLHGWLAVPNTVDSAWIDVYALPSRQRVAEAVGRSGTVQCGSTRPPITMSVRITLTAHAVLLVGGYEDGSLVWAHKPHRESIMSMCLGPDASHVYSVGADDRIVCTALTPDATPHISGDQHPGNACVAVRGDARVLAVGGWDAMVRVFALPAMQPLAVLAYHKDSVYAAAYTPAAGSPHFVDLCDDSSSEDERGAGPLQPSAHVHSDRFACGGKDGRVSLWDVPFTAA
ncbi:Astra associated protein 1 Asa1 [Malassezia sp. CBS 17886]|nr:Astra associated protein 1 Asa1 [Malassezia sp. CBS 17886]